MNKYITTVALVLSVLFSTEAYSQQTKLPYYCGFDDAEENARWTLNYNPNLAPGRLKNLWHIGTAVAAEGDSSLYVSSDCGATASYTNSENTILAYRVFDLPPGTYDLAFDWMAYGDATSVIRVAWVDDTEDKVFSLTSSNLPAPVKDNLLFFEEEKSKDLSGAGVWKHTATQIKVEYGKKYKLVFAWSNSTAQVLNPGGCIDNLEIAETLCEKPTDVEVSNKDSGVAIAWNGNASEYQVGYKKSSTDVWTYIEELEEDEKKCIIPRLENGVYDFRVRGICGSDTSLWVVSDKLLVYSALCIDYVNLDAAECRYGKVSEMSNGGGTEHKVDYGYDDIRSRHTIHFLSDEIDPRTNSILKTVPDGEVASVRVGNWEKTAKAESVTYRYKVDSTVAQILTLKYAIVFEDPGHPNIKDQPHFLLQIFDDISGEQILSDCASADFYARSGIDGWTTFRYQDRDIVWKNWTTLGINLGSLHDKTIRIKVSIFGCTLGAHYAYAYFTLGCSSGKLEGISCGDNPTTEFIAPDGFKYRWYEKGKNYQVLCENDTFPVDPSDTRDYCVDVIYPEDETCFFTLYANATPRFPKAKFEHSIRYDKCRAYVDCRNKSYVETQFGTSPDEVETVRWLVDGIVQTRFLDSISFRLPNDGKVHKIQLIAGLCDNLCADTAEIEVRTPVLNDTIIELTERICVAPEDYDPSASKLDKVDSLETFAGCDSVVITHNKYVTSTDTTLEAEICSDSIYDFNGRFLTASGVYRDTLPSADGCDSIVILNLTVNEVLDVSTRPVVEVCSDDDVLTVGLEILSGSIDSIGLQFGAPALVSGFDNEGFVYEGGSVGIDIPDSLKPGVYDLAIVAYNHKCGSVEMNMEISALYPKSMIAQKWNDVLAVLNSEYNGGFDFVSFQWRANGVDILGATDPYLYIESEGLDTATLYSVVLQDANGLKLATCPLKPVVKENISEYPQLLSPANAGQSLSLVADPLNWYRVRIYDTAGILLSDNTVPGNGVLLAPDNVGVFVVVVDTDADSYVLKLIVR